MSEPPGEQPDRGRSTPATRLPSLGPRGEGWFVIQVFLVLLIAFAGWLLPPDWSGAPRFTTSVVGVVLLLGSGVLLVAGIRDLARSMSPFPRPRDDGAMVEGGVYRRLRHPIYAGVILAALGWALLSAAFLAIALALLLVALLDLKARREELWLRERYPEYADYASRTRRFVPGIY